MGSLSAPASGEVLPMKQEFKQGYRMHMYSVISTGSMLTGWATRIGAESRLRETFWKR